ncbi:MAG: hypothetical protein KatS3mg101_0400 [Patescibacteria group bacterium]|nr:MAG: hypothetical protein KatS3mg101_0400 [Patescibacteria group bacterium]
MEDTSQTVEIGFCDPSIAEAAIKKYRQMFPEDDYTPEVETGQPERGWSVIVKVPRSKYIMFDTALSAALGGF